MQVTVTLVINKASDEDPAQSEASIKEALRDELETLSLEAQDDDQDEPTDYMVEEVKDIILVQ